MSNSNNINSDKKMAPRIDKIEPVALTKWLALQTYHYTDQEGKQRLWDVAARTTTTKAGVDAVVIVPILKSSSSSSTNNMDTLLVEQFRPPIQQASLEFPAGLIDEGESPEAAALRELREETGYVGERCSTPPIVSRPVCMSPGMTTETVHIVLVQVDLDNPYNQGTPTPALEDGEHVQVHRVPLKAGLDALLDSPQFASTMPIEGVYLFAMGLQLGWDAAKAEKNKEGK